MMSFTENVKNELARRERPTKEEREAELLALLRMNGELVTGMHGAWGAEFSTSNNAVARRVLVCLKKDFALQPTVMVRQGRKLRKKNVYTLAVPPSPEGTKFLKELGLLPLGTEQDLPEEAGPDALRAYLAGVFLGSGSVSRPQSDYHLEIVTQSHHMAEYIMTVMKSFHLSPRMTDRKNDYIVYVKDGDDVTSFLQVVGASQSYMDFENVRVMKDVRNKVNRQVNCETANLQKTVDAAVRQLHQIERILAVMPASSLPAKLREACELRQEHPNASLAELSSFCGVSKSGLAHRFQKIAALSASLKDQEK